MRKKIIITGGHLTPALATIAVLESRGWEIVYVGRRNALEGDETISQEFRQIKSMGIRFINLTTGRLQRKLTFHGLISLLKVPLGLVNSCKILKGEQPQVVLSFGGYIALPIAIGAWFMRIPVITHEQTSAAGLANRIIGIFARKICISQDVTTGFFSKSKICLTGIPIRPEIFQVKEKINIDEDKPLLYITGGSLGAHSLNVLIEPIIGELIQEFAVIHQCGETVFYKDYERLSGIKEKLAKALKHRYYPIPYLNQNTIGWVLNSARIIVARAGANTVSEILILKKPAMFVPLPWAGGDEQLKNAKLLSVHDAALVVLQKNLTPDLLLQQIKLLYKKRHTFQSNLQIMSKNFIQDGASRLVNVVESEV
ncbi:MAG: UDP-N-acetylglucosamine--N-acetylmuramyl-(pentapeptide) pyrophosphoryl-undecaprenol N-acetylglucosamine transferase [Patescibacteria group bacterium]